MLFTLLLAAAIGSPTARMTIPPIYFPMLSGKPVRVLSGVLDDYEIGAKGGSLELRLHDGTLVEIRIAGNGMTWNDAPLRCVDPPRPPRFAFNRDGCAVWPRALKLGSARVDVPVWDGVFQRRHVWVTDEIRSSAR